MSNDITDGVLCFSFLFSSFFFYLHLIWCCVCCVCVRACAVLRFSIWPPSWNWFVSRGWGVTPALRCYFYPLSLWPFRTSSSCDNPYLGRWHWPMYNKWYFLGLKIAPQSGHNPSAPWRKPISRWWPYWKSQHGTRTHARTHNTRSSASRKKKKKKRKKSRAPRLWCHLTFIFALQNKIKNKINLSSRSQVIVRKPNSRWLP